MSTVRLRDASCGRAYHDKATATGNGLRITSSQNCSSSLCVAPWVVYRLPWIQ